MGLYSKTSFDLLCEQVSRDNPELEVPFSRATVILLQGPLTTNLGTSKRNTRAIFNGIQGSGVSGKREVFYDRVDLGKLYGPAKIAASAPATATVVKDMLPSLNAKLGLQLEPADLANGDSPLGAAAAQGSFTLQIAATSVSYTGSLAIKWVRAPVGTFPESGPGTKVMKFGSLDAGYFGTVSASEVLNKIAFYNAVNDGTTPDAGVMAPEAGDFYFKFAYKGRFLLVPADPFIDQVSWLEIYGKGCMYSPLRNNDFIPPNTPVADQKSTILSVKEGKKTWQLKPRLGAATVDDPTETISYLKPNSGGEWWDLFRHTTKLGPAATGLWDDKPNLGQGRWYEWLYTTFKDPNNLNGMYLMPNHGLGTDGPKTTKTTTTYRWRPILEVVNDLNLLQGVKYGGSQVTGRLPSIVLNIELPPATERLAGVINVKGTIDAPAAGPIVETYVESIFPLKDVRWETDAAKAIGKGPVVDVVSERTLAIKHFKWTASDLPAVSNVSITR